jgi:hypothetical protein
LIFTTPEQVKSSVRKNSSAPVWNERLILPGLFPPMCQRFKIELLHGDTKRAVRFLNLRSISDDKEEGFLPTFGPDFVHFYSPNHLEGYLGKILLSLQTTLLEDLTEYEAKAHLEGQDAPPLDEIMFPQCEDVVLFATIFEASSISRRFSDKPISFRMSCGPLHVDESGDKVEATVTPPLKPQIMNKNYCFVPIDEEKPCLHLTLSLPDVRKRMFNYNLLTKMLTSLVLFHNNSPMYYFGLSEDKTGQNRRRFRKQRLQHCKHPNRSSAFGDAGLYSFSCWQVH